ncbi:MAG: hypothetical protein GTO02_08320 [Candidatus Dadabacteria bacterium]|nr:hypothetical protein [Candidatus Dadabacteria bacterium]NIQ14392.1 hypothetical protein [Candidatus Dadabacteria bacterium]
MEEYWGATKAQVIEKAGTPHEENKNETSGLEELTYIYSPEKDFQAQKHITYGFVEDRLVIISTGYEFKENLFKQFELFHGSLKKNWNDDLGVEPTKDTFEDDDGNKVTIWNKSNSEITLFFTNDPANPHLVVIERFKPG